LLSFATRTRAGGRREPFSGHPNIDRCSLGAISCGSVRGSKLGERLWSLNTLSYPGDYSQRQVADQLSVLNVATHCRPRKRIWAGLDLRVSRETTRPKRSARDLPFHVKRRWQDFDAVEFQKPEIVGRSAILLVSSQPDLATLVGPSAASREPRRRCW
jgi:hypothetical protein